MEGSASSAPTSQSPPQQTQQQPQQAQAADAGAPPNSHRVPSRPRPRTSSRGSSSSGSGSGKRTANGTGRMGNTVGWGSNTNNTNRGQGHGTRAREVGRSGDHGAEAAPPRGKGPDSPPPEQMYMVKGSILFSNVSSGEVSLRIDDTDATQHLACFRPEQSNAHPSRQAGPRRAQRYTAADLDIDDEVCLYVSYIYTEAKTKFFRVHEVLNVKKATKPPALGLDRNRANKSVSSNEGSDVMSSPMNGASSPEKPSPQSEFHRVMPSMKQLERVNSPRPQRGGRASPAKSSSGRGTQGSSAASSSSSDGPRIIGPVPVSQISKVSSEGGTPALPPLRKIVADKKAIFKGQDGRGGSSFGLDGENRTGVLQEGQECAVVHPDGKESKSKGAQLASLLSVGDPVILDLESRHGYNTLVVKKVTLVKKEVEKKPATSTSEELDAKPKLKEDEKSAEEVKPPTPPMEDKKAQEPLEEDSSSAKTDLCPSAPEFTPQPSPPATPAPEPAELPRLSNGTTAHDNGFSDIASDVSGETVVLRETTKVDADEVSKNEDAVPDIVQVAGEESKKEGGDEGKKEDGGAGEQDEVGEESASVGPLVQAVEETPKNDSAPKDDDPAKEVDIKVQESSSQEPNDASSNSTAPTPDSLRTISSLSTGSLRIVEASDTDMPSRETSPTSVEYPPSEGEPTAAGDATVPDSSSSEATPAAAMPPAAMPVPPSPHEEEQDRLMHLFATSAAAFFMENLSQTTIANLVSDFKDWYEELRGRRTAGGVWIEAPSERVSEMRRFYVEHVVDYLYPRVSEDQRKTGVKKYLDQFPKPQNPVGENQE